MKGQSPKAQLSPSKVRVLAKRRQTSVGGSFRTRSPDPGQLSSLRERGAQDASRTQTQRGPADWVLCRLLPLLGGRDRDEWEFHYCLKAWAQPVGGLGEGSGALQDRALSLFPGPLSSLAGPRPGKLEEEKAGTRLLPHCPPDDHHYTDWMHSLPVAHWWLIACGQAPLQHRPMAEQDH